MRLIICVQGRAVGEAWGRSKNGKTKANTSWVHSWAQVLIRGLYIISHSPYCNSTVQLSPLSFQRGGHWVTETLSNFPTATQWHSDGKHAQEWAMLHDRLKQDTKRDNSYVAKLFMSKEHAFSELWPHTLHICVFVFKLLPKCFSVFPQKLNQE